MFFGRTLRDFISSTLTNLSAPMPRHRKVWLITRNLSLRLVRRQPCCGHPGEPGC